MNSGFDFERELDRVKAKVFMSNNAAFLGTIMTSLRFEWVEADHEIRTAATDGISFWWNKDFFMRSDEKTRRSTMLHELWHVGRLHMIRQGTRDNQIWNYACDIRINNDLAKEGDHFTGIQVLVDPSFDVPDVMAEEDIYDKLFQNPPPPPPAGGGGSFGEGDFDMKPLTDQQQINVVQTVVKAVQFAKMAKQAGNLPGIIEQTISRFLEPVIPWEKLLMEFFTDLLDEDHTWARPNRRHHDIYLPSRFTDDGRLEHLMFFEDVSGSITDADLLRFNSEVKYVKDVLNPQKLTLVQFDTKIQSEKTLTEYERFDEVVIVGRGGTDLHPVREHILKHRPTAVVVFSDLECTPMVPLGAKIPIIWVVMNNRSERPPFGKFIHINNNGVVSNVQSA